MSNAVYSKTMKKVRNRIDVELVRNEKELKWTSKPIYISRNIFYNDLVTISKRKVTLKLSKPAHAGMYILDLSKVLMNKLH